MTIEELKEKTIQVKIESAKEHINLFYEEIMDDIKNGMDYVDAVSNSLYCHICPFKTECKELTDFECSADKCHYFVEKYVDKPIIKMSIDEFLNKHLEMLRVKLKNEALQGKWDNLGIYIQVCDTCPLKSECPSTEECPKILQEHISLNEDEIMEEKRYGTFNYTIKQYEAFIEWVEKHIPEYNRNVEYVMDNFGLDEEEAKDWLTLSY